jgi:hypothetical protein
MRRWFGGAPFTEFEFELGPAISLGSVVEVV